MQPIGSRTFFTIVNYVGLSLIALALAGCASKGNEYNSISNNKTIQLTDSLIANQQFPLTKDLLGFYTVVLETNKKNPAGSECAFASLALFYHHKSEMHLLEAIRMGTKIQEQAIDQLNEKHRAHLYNDLGICMAMQGIYDSALVNIKLAIPLLDKQHDSTTLAKSYNALGNIHLILKSSDLALSGYKNAFRINKLQKNESGIALNMLNIASVLEDKKKPDSALLTLIQALPMAQRKGSKNLIAKISNNIGSLYFRRKQYDSAYYYYNLSITQKQIHDPHTEVSLSVNMAYCMFNLGKEKQAIDSMLVLTSRIRKYGMGSTLIEHTHNLSQLYEKKKDFSTALRYERLSGKIKDSIALKSNNSNVDETNKKVNVTEQEYKKQLKNNLEVQKIKQSRNLLIYLIAFSIVFSFFMFLAYRQQRTTSKKLRDTSQKLEEANQNLQKISEIGQDIITHTTQRDIIKKLFELLQGLIKTDVLAIATYNADSKSLEFVNAIEENETRPVFQYPISHSNNLLVHCFITQTSIIINDIKNDHLSLSLPETLIESETGEQMQAMIFIPLTVNQNQLGVFSVQSVEANVYNPHIVSTLRSISAYLAIALQNTINYNSVISQRDQLNQAITKLQAGEKELRESTAAKDKLFGIIAHDLKNPFSSILGFSDVLARDWDNFDEKTRRTFIRSISLASQSTYRLLENLLMWSRTQTGGLLFNPENIDLGNVALEAIKVVINQAEAKNIKITSHIPFNLHVVADENMLLTILRNLLTNAIKFSQQGGLITLSATLNTNTYQITITDNGIGISSTDQQKLFKIDQSAKRAGTENETGSGLGLLLCHELISKHDGQIWVESQPGKGSSFTFALPIHCNHQK